MPIIRGGAISATHIATAIVMLDIIISMHRAAGASFPCALSISGIIIEAGKGGAEVRISFQMLDFDDLGNAGDVLPPLNDGTRIDGVNLSVASAPPDICRQLNYKNIRKLDFDCMLAAYRLGAPNIRRINRDATSASWMFRPSWGTRLFSDGWRLPDEKIDKTGCRAGDSGLFPRAIKAPPAGVDACEHIYEFCKSRMRRPKV